MTKQFFKFPSIDQFRQVIKSLRDQANYHEIDPTTLSFKLSGTVKLHGTNASVVLTKGGDYYAQSRNNILSLEKDNAEFCAFSMKPQVKEFISTILQKVQDNFSKSRDFLDENREILASAVYGEWAGQGIQKNVAISQVDKFFAPFGICIYLKPLKAEQGEFERIWLNAEMLAEFYNEQLRIFPVTLSTVYEYELKLDDISLAQATQDLAKFTDDVEKEDPFAKKMFGVSGVGEGIVWEIAKVSYADGSYFDKPIQFDGKFKVKGEKHSVSKVKTIVQIDPEHLRKVQEFVDYAVTENRCNQAIDYLKEQHLPIDQTSTGQFIKWIMEDVLKEEQDVLLANDLSWKSVSGNIAKQSKVFFVDYLNNNF